MRARKHLATSLPSTYVPGLHKTISLSVFPLSEHLLCRHRSNVSIRCSTVLKRRRATYPQSPPRGHLRRRAALQFRQARRLALSTHSCHSYSRRCDASEHVICCKCHYKDCCCSPLIGTFDSDPCVEVGGFFFFFFFFCSPSPYDGGGRGWACAETTRSHPGFPQCKFPTDIEAA